MTTAARWSPTGGSFCASRWSGCTASFEVESRRTVVGTGSGRPAGRTLGSAMADEENTDERPAERRTRRAGRDDLPRAALEAEGPRPSGRMRRGPFIMGFLLTLGGLVAFQLGMAALRLSQVWVLILVVDVPRARPQPAGRVAHRAGPQRGGAIAVVFVGFIALFALFIGALVPPLIEQGTAVRRQRAGVHRPARQATSSSSGSTSSSASSISSRSWPVPTWRSRCSAGCSASAAPW